MPKTYQNCVCWAKLARNALRGDHSPSRHCDYTRGDRNISEGIDLHSPSLLLFVSDRPGLSSADSRTEIERPYKVWAYPITPIAFLAITLWMMIYVILDKTTESLLSDDRIAGLIIYFFAREPGENSFGALEIVDDKDHEASLVSDKSEFVLFTGDNIRVW
jgi:hypothetical protein